METTGRTKSNRLIEFGAKTPTGFTRNHFIPMNSYQDMVKKYHFKDTYLSVYSYTNPDIKSSDLLGNFYIDLDADLSSDEAFNKLRNDAIIVINYLKHGFLIPEDQIRIYYSGAKGVHIIVPYEVFAVKPTPFLHIIYKNMANKIMTNTGIQTLDIQIYDNRRLFRIPNTINTKTGLFKIPITNQELAVLSFEEIKQLATKQRIIQQEENLLPCVFAQKKYMDMVDEYTGNLNKKKERNVTFRRPEKLFMPSCIKNIMENGAPIGLRNNCTAFFASYLMQNGFTEQEILDNVIQWNLNCNADELNERELETTVKSIYRLRYAYGCSKAKELGLCGGEDGCRIARQHYDKEMRKGKQISGKQ